MGAGGACRSAGIGTRVVLLVVSQHGIEAGLSKGFCVALTSCWICYPEREALGSHGATEQDIWIGG